MSHPPPQQRPPFPPQSQSFTHGFQQPNPRPQYGPQSPAHAVSYSSPSPQPQFPPAYNGQAPAAKRPRLSPDATPSFSQPVGTSMLQAGSPINGHVNGIAVPGQQRTTLMPPPQQPFTKKDNVGSESQSSVFSDGNALNFGPVSPMLPVSLPPSTPQTPQYPGQPLNTVEGPVARPGLVGPPYVNVPQPTAEEQIARLQERQNWEEARHAQHELWDAFLYGGAVNDKIKTLSQRANLIEPQSGVLVNTQKTHPPPQVRVNGYEGATRVIKDGQSILDTRDKAQRLTDLVKILSLGAKARLTGIVQAAAVICEERRKHSQGRVPDGWEDVAVVSRPAESETASISAAAPGMKRPHAAIIEFEKLSKIETKAEADRQAKRRKRTDAAAAKESEANAAADEVALAAAAAENEKARSKKQQKIDENRLSELNAPRHTNEAIFMATSNIFGKKKGKNYSWMSGGTAASTPSGTGTPTRTAQTTPAKNKAPQPATGSRMGQFDEGKEPGIQARDMLLVLESDGRAARSFVRGSSTYDDSKPA
ncbi:hypothetical protein LTS08_007647 [Lithohypha guttulata]|nr:hypothetical protein LTS08_007647 [Lithohypha guttulata]